MIGQNVKHVISVPASTASSATQTVQIDTKGFDQCDVAVITGTASATTAPLTLKVTESDATVISNATTFSPFLGGTDFTIAARADTNSAVAAHFSVDCRARKRYLFVSYCPGTTAVAVIHATLSRPDSAPDTTTERGVEEFRAG